MMDEEESEEVGVEEGMQGALGSGRRGEQVQELTWRQRV